MVVGNTGLLTLLNSSSGAYQATIYGAGVSSVNSLVLISPNLVAGASADYKVYFWSSNFKVQTSMTTTHSASLLCMVLVAPDSVAIGSADFTAKVFNITTGSQLFSYTGHSNSVSGLILLSDGNIASWSTDTVKVWNWKTGQTLTTITSNSGYYVSSVVQVSDDLIAIGDANRKIRIWYIGNGTLFKVLKLYRQIYIGY